MRSNNNTKDLVSIQGWRFLISFSLPLVSFLRTDLVLQRGSLCFLGVPQITSGRGSSCIVSSTADIPTWQCL